MTIKSHTKIAGFIQNGHKPKTRREFVAQGYFGIGAVVASQSILGSILSGRAYGAPTCKAADSVSSSSTPFLVFDLAGGANFAGSNIIVGKAGGQMDFITDYATLGLPADMHPKNAGQTNTEMGLVFHNDSALLRGIKSTAQATTLAKVDGMIFCAASGDDTANNPHNPMYWINKAGAEGALIGLLGTRASESGGNSRAPQASVNPAARPAVITKPEDAMGLVSLGKLATLLRPERAEKIMKAVEKMSSAQLAVFQEKDLPAQIRDLVQCGYLESSDLINRFDAASLDARQDQMITAPITGTNTPLFNLQDANSARVAAVAKLLVDGNAGAATITLPGYDYHDNTRATGELRDFAAGAEIGRSLELAARKNKDLAIYLYTDGGVTSSGQIDSSANGRGKGVWRGDSGQRSATVMLVFKSDDKPEIRNGNRQIGTYKEGGAVDNAFNLISNSVENLSKAVVANYLALQGRESDLAKIVGNNPFGAELEKYLGFTKLRS
jgi:hypothetical protein